MYKVSFIDCGSGFQPRLELEFWFLHIGLACDEPLGRELRVERLRAERLG